MPKSKTQKTKKKKLTSIEKYQEKLRIQNIMAKMGKDIDWSYNFKYSYRDLPEFY